MVVIGYDVWQSQFAGDQAIVGREIRIGRDAHTIVGVMPRGVRFPRSIIRYWIPLRVRSARGGRARDRARPRRVRPPRPGATKESAQAELSAIGRRLAAEGPGSSRTLQPRIVPYVDIFVNGEAANETANYALMRFLIASSSSSSP